MRKCLFPLVTLGAALMTAPAMAGTVSVVVRDQAGRPLPNAVVSITVPGRGAPATLGWPARVSQKDIQFSPYVLVVPRGARVSLPNLDKVRHHVYSFSKAKKFSLPLYGRDETKFVTFDVAGTVALGCNIHDQMSGFIRVVDTPWVAKTGADGIARINDVPAGKSTITVWHPQAKAKNGEFSAAFIVESAGPTAKAVTLNTVGQVITRP